MTHIEQRLDDSTVWTSVNPIMHSGEAGHEKDTGKWKLGDGVTAWNDLPYKAGVDSVAGQTGVVTLAVADVTGVAPLASPAFTGSPTAPTPSASDNDTSLATTAFVKTQVNDMATQDFVMDMLLAMHPVGDIKMSTANVNPGTYLGGTWEAWGSGRVPVGVDGAQPEFNTVEETGGAKTHTLTVAELASHDHPIYTRDPAGPGTAIGLITGASGAMFANSGTVFTFQNEPVGLRGGGQPHNNLQPYITCYMWKRTA